jgi:hypothetical protein
MFFFLEKAITKSRDIPEQMLILIFVQINPKLNVTHCPFIVVKTIKLGLVVVHALHHLVVLL